MKTVWKQGLLSILFQLFPSAQNSTQQKTLAPLMLAELMRMKARQPEVSLFSCQSLSIVYDHSNYSENSFSSRSILLYPSFDWKYFQPRVTKITLNSDLNKWGFIFLTDVFESEC